MRLLLEAVGVMDGEVRQNRSRRTTLFHLPPVTKATEMMLEPVLGGETFLRAMTLSVTSFVTGIAQFYLLWGARRVVIRLPYVYTFGNCCPSGSLPEIFDQVITLYRAAGSINPLTSEMAANLKMSAIQMEK